MSASEKKITLRVSEQEKDLLERKAVEYGMSLNQFIKHKLFEEIEGDTEKSTESFEAVEFLNKHLPLLARMIIDSYFYLELLSTDQISSTKLDKSNSDALKLFRKLGIAKNGVPAMREVDENNT